MLMPQINSSPWYQIWRHEPDMWTLKTAGEIEANSNTICHNNAKNWKRQFNDQIPIVRFHLATIVFNETVRRAVLRAHQYWGEGVILNEYVFVFTSLITSFYFAISIKLNYFHLNISQKTTWWHNIKISTFTF